MFGVFVYIDNILLTKIVWVCEQHTGDINKYITFPMWIYSYINSAKEFALGHPAKVGTGIFGNCFRR